LSAGAADVDGVLGGASTGAASGKAEIGIDWTLVNGEVLRWVEGYAFELIRLLDERSRTALSEAIQRWTANGLPLPDLIEELTPIFGPVRAELIASTEVTRAYAEAQLRAWQASGVIERMTWRTANDERVCPVCSALGGVAWGEDGAAPTTIADQVAEGVVTAIGQPFVHPGGHGAQARWAGQAFRAPPAHPRCRCWVAAVV
jgi:SPP1 gp7 family putative phage head morphogenesis protein